MLAEWEIEILRRRVILAEQRLSAAEEKVAALLDVGDSAREVIERLNAKLQAMTELCTAAGVDLSMMQAKAEEQVP